MVCPKIRCSNSLCYVVWLMLVMLTVLTVKICFQDFDTDLNQFHLAWPNGPVQSIVYLKIPKTASSTIRGIFHRYCERHSIPCAPFPPRSESSFYTSEEIDSLLNVERRRRRRMQPVAIFGPHFFYDQQQMAAFRPYAVRVVSLRNPIARLRSDFMYRKEYWNGFREFDNFSHFINVCHRLLSTRKTSFDLNESNTIIQCQSIQNQQVRYLSGNEMNNSEPDSFETALTNLVADRFVILLTEFLEESLILMAHKLRWALSDVVYLSFKTDGYGAMTTADDVQKIKQFDSSDVYLYNIARELFLKRLGELKEQINFHKSLADFRAMQQALRSRCNLTSWTPANEIKLINMCHMFFMDEIEYLRKDKCERVRGRTHAWVFFYHQPTKNSKNQENYRVHCIPRILLKTWTNMSKVYVRW